MKRISSRKRKPSSTSTKTSSQSSDDSRSKRSKKSTLVTSNSLPNPSAESIGFLLKRTDARIELGELAETDVPAGQMDHSSINILEGESNSKGSALDNKCRHNLDHCCCHPSQEQNMIMITKRLVIEINMKL